MWAVPSLGIDPATGAEMFRKKDGSQTFIYSTADEVVVGCSRPDVEGVIGSSFYYKGFSASVNFRYRLGGRGDGLGPVLESGEYIGRANLL